jgi:predicted RNase H-like nuclease (RuvC/YqgF family)
MIIEMLAVAVGTATISTMVALKARATFAYARRERASFQHLEFLLDAGKEVNREMAEEIHAMRNENASLRREVAELNARIAEMGAAMTIMQASLERMSASDLTDRALKRANETMKKSLPKPKNMGDNGGA